MKQLFLLVLTASTVISVNAQKQSSFTINGKINADSGTVIIVPCDEGMLDSTQYNFEEVRVQRESFVINGSIPHTLMCLLLLRQNDQTVYMSGSFFIDPGTNTITFDSHFNRQSPLALNNSTIQFQAGLAKQLDIIQTELYLLNTEEDSLHVKYNYRTPDSLQQVITSKIKSTRINRAKALEKFVSEHPNSYVGLWKLAELFSRGYSPYMDSIFVKFSDSIKTVCIGKTFKRNIDALKTTSIGGSFPSFDVKDITNKIINTNDITRKSTYTLVDFWFSHCGSCIGQFPYLQKLYDKYKGKGFDIIGISTDGKENIPEWHRVIQAKKINWKQYLDEDGRIANSLVINVFPTNFLLKDGIIIRKDILPWELENILMMNK